MSWLCPTPNDRDRFIEMQGKLGLARAVTIVIGIGLAFQAEPQIGWLIVVLTGAMIAVVLIGKRHLERRRRPELWVFFTTVVNIQAVIAIAAVLQGGPRSPLPSMVAIPVVMVATRFSDRGLMIGAPLSAAVVLATTLGVDPGYVSRHPESLWVPLAVVLCTALYVHPLLSSDVSHRVSSTLDELTGLLNRRALAPRLAEISQQAAQSSQPVSFIACDLDRFKDVNDRHGHAAGDLILKQATDAMRSCLRSFELLYRLGGDEFLLVLPGAEEPTAVAVADCLRAAVESVRAGGLPITCSCGVATSRGRDVAPDALLDAADRALYAAKRAGGNRTERSTANDRLASQAVAGVACQPV